MENIIQEAVSNFGWNSRKIKDSEYVLSNRNNKEVISVKLLSKDRYKFIATGYGRVIMTGKGMIAESLRKLLKDYYYCKENG